MIRGVNRTHLALLAAVTLVFAWSGVGPKDRLTWLLEVFPIILAAPVILFTYKRFRFTGLAYGLMAAHAVILMVGGHYTYAEVPLFNWIRDHFGLARNHYDRLGHFAQGFVPAILAREVLIRTSPLRPGGWLTFIVLCIALAISAFYELVEWWVALLTGSAGDAFLGTQGDVWDTQWDMFFCLIGATVSLVLLSSLHDRLIAALSLNNKEPRTSH